jgi:mannose-6-phosphate isomerase-like protein (cupin superfamily)
MPNTHTRRSVLRVASATVAAISLPRAAHALVATDGVQGRAPQPSQLLTADRMKSALTVLASKPGTKNDEAIFGAKILPFTVALTVETNTIDTQFEYHEDRDHLFQILDGETILEVDGTPQRGHSEQPGQWHSPTSQGTSVHTLRKGDMLLIPRGAPHKRSTAKSVTFMLISVTSPVTPAP